jgi:hypothetical protein
MDKKLYFPHILLKMQSLFRKRLRIHDRSFRRLRLPHPPHELSPGRGLDFIPLGQIPKRTRSRRDGSRAGSTGSAS